MVGSGKSVGRCSRKAIAAAVDSAVQRERSCATRSSMFFLLDHLIGPQQQCRRDRYPERPCGPDIDDQLELSRLLDGEVAWPGALEDLVDVDGGPPDQVVTDGAVG